MIHGTADVNAPVSTTLRLAEALAKARKLHDLAILPQETHHFSQPAEMYADMVTIAYFKEHL